MSPRPPRPPLFPYTTLFRSLVDDVRLVGEEEMLEAIAWLMTRENVVAEPAGAAATAAWLKEVRRADATASDARASVLLDRKSTRLNSSHRCISYAVFCLKKK